jgi:hypothetical protein
MRSRRFLRMRKKLVAVLVGIAIAGSLGQVAWSKSDNNNGKSGFKRAFVFHGTLTGVDGDGDATPGLFTMTVDKANGNAKRYLATNPGDVSIALAPDTRFYGKADDASDFAVGDEVMIKARNSESGLVARKVKLKAEEVL